MSPADQSDSENRIAQLEQQLAHTQRTVDQLNEVVLENTRRLDHQQRSMKAMQQIIERLKHRSESLEGAAERDPLAEKPPHY